jgi:hypothetical protein
MAASSEALMKKQQIPWQDAKKQKKWYLCAAKLEHLCDRKTSLSKHLQSILQQFRLTNPFFL